MNARLLAGSACLSLCTLLPAAAAAQALTSLSSVRVGYTTRKNTVKPQGELKAQIDALDTQIADATRLGRIGELRRLFAKGMALLSSGDPFIAFAAFAAAVAFTPGGAAAQPRIDPMAETVAPLLTMIERDFVSLADAMPAEKYGFKPTAGEFKGVRTFGEQVKHVACANFAFYNEIEKKTPPEGCETGGPSPAKTKAELMAYLRESFAYAGRVLKTMTPANAMEPAGGPYGGPSTRLGIATLSIWHASDHYGQLVVYLRLNGIVPPASR